MPPPPPPLKKYPGSAPEAIHRNVINLSNNFLFWQKMTIINFGTSHEKFRLESQRFLSKSLALTVVQEDIHLRSAISDIEARTRY